MRRDLATAPVTMRISEFRSRFPLGSTKFVAAVDQAGAFVGLADVADIHARWSLEAPSDATDATLEHSLIYPGAWVEASTRFDLLMPLFEQLESELLVVVDDKRTKRVIGLITEAFALRRYRQELDARRREMFGL
jgi:CIC family chloride channel protein